MERSELKKIPASHFLNDNHSGDCGFVVNNKVKSKLTTEKSTITRIDAYIPLMEDAVCYFIDLDNGKTMGISDDIGCAMEGKKALDYYQINGV